MDRDLGDWARLLARNWEARARTGARDLFVASHPKWRDPEAWLAHARTELDLFLSGLDRAALRSHDVLEIGCGSGRLAVVLRPLVRSYSGFDIAPSMVAAAVERCRGLDGVRLTIGDGLGVPAELCDRDYQMVFACAVFIHCPREVIASNLRSAWARVAKGGQLRFQVLADPTDDEGYAVPIATVAAATAALVGDEQATIAQLTPEELRLATHEYYMGHRFRFAEVAPFVSQQCPGKVELYRGDPGSIYGAITKS